MIRSQTCAICDKVLEAGAASTQYFPFCSERCRNIDLYRWTEGQYAIVEPLDEDRLLSDEIAFDEDSTESE